MEQMPVQNGAGLKGEGSEFPAKVPDLLVDHSSKCVADKGKWLSFLQYEWRM
jgi:hypothetical protein